jgi:hypothetical protein
LRRQGNPRKRTNTAGDPDGADIAGQVDGVLPLQSIIAGCIMASVLRPDAARAARSEVTTEPRDQRVVVVVDRQNGWRVIRPSFGSVVTLVLVLPATLIATMCTVIGIVLIIRRQESVGMLIAILAFAAVLLAAYHSAVFLYFVAFDQHHVATGRRLGAPRTVVARDEIRQVMWSDKYRKTGGRLLDRDGEVLVSLEAVVSRRQVKNLARELGLPFRS